MEKRIHDVPGPEVVKFREIDDIVGRDWVRGGRKREGGGVRFRE